MSSRLHPRFALHPLAAASMAALALLSAASALAQDAPAPAEAKADVKADVKAEANVEPKAEAEADQNAGRIEVVGTRASLQRAVSLKRDAATVQDSISALELGRFPDDNVADSLGHITGVAIKRTAGGEGKTVSVRGLGPEYTMTTFNGRILGTDGAGRDFAFDVLPSDVISGADVVKGAQASLTEGAIGGLVNLRSASPFEQRGQHGIVRLEGDRNMMTELNGSKLSAAYSNTFGDNFGVLFGVVYAHRKERTDIAGNDGGWTRNPVPSDQSWMWGNAWGGNIDLDGDGELDTNEEGLIAPGQFRIGSILTDKKRVALSGKLEWRPSSELKVVLDGIYTKLDAPEIGYQQSYYPLFAPGRWSNVVVNSKGIVTDFTLDNPDPELRLNPELLNQSTHRVVNTSLYGINAQWKPTDTLTLVGDLYRSTSSRHSGGLDTYAVLRMNQPNVTRIRLTGEPVPEVTTTFADGRDLATGVFTAQDFNTHYLSLGGDNIDDKITGTSLSGEWAVEKYGVDVLHFGLAATDRKKSRDLVNNALTGGDGYYADANAINVAALGGNVVSHSFKLPHFMDGVNSKFPRTFMGFDVPAYLERLKAYNGQARPDGGVYDFAEAGPSWNPLESYRVSEKTIATYLQADLSGEKWNADVGVRLVNTRTASQAWDAKITSITQDGQFNYIVDYAPAIEVNQDGDYTFALPSANFVWHFTDKLQLRLGAAKTMARPPVDKLAPTSSTASVAWGEFTQIFGGNVDLKPYSAVQTDASLEWYYAKNSIFNIAVFQKDIKNQITTSWQTGQDIGVPGYLFNVMRPINGDKAKVNGVEVGLQHLWDNGFGVRAQYTRNHATSWVAGEKRPLEGIAPATSSLGLLYEKGAWSTSVDIDHTDGFTTAVNVLGNGYNEEVRPVTWVSASLSYAVTDDIRISLEGRNLADTVERYSISGNDLLPQGYFRYGRAFQMGVSFNF